MLCRKCKEQIEVGEPCRAEPTETGSPQYHFFHPGCYTQLKDERQKELPFDRLEQVATQARSVC